MTKEELISQITSTISANGNQDITGTKLQEVLVSIVGTLYSAIDEAIISASPGDFTELILQTLGTRVDATMSQKAITDALTALNYGVNAIPAFARIERLLADIRPVINNQQALIPGEIVYVTFEPSIYTEGLYEGFYFKVESGEYYTWFENAHLYKAVDNTPKYNKLFECAEDGKQYVIVRGSTIEKPNLVMLGVGSTEAVAATDIPKFNGFHEGVVTTYDAVAPSYEGIYFLTTQNTFAAKSGSTFFLRWDTSHDYLIDEEPIPNRLFEYNKRQYVFGGQELKPLTVNSVELAQELGDSTELAVSQKAVTEAVDSIVGGIDSILDSIINT